jgi:hypothetical protein
VPDDAVFLFGGTADGDTEGRLVVGAPQVGRYLLIVGEDYAFDLHRQVTIRVQPSVGGGDRPWQIVPRNPAERKRVAHERPIDAIHGVEYEQHVRLFVASTEGRGCGGQYGRSHDAESRRGKERV